MIQCNNTPTSQLKLYPVLMQFKSSNQQWLGKISLQTPVRLCKISCLRGAVYCLILKEYKELTCAFLLVVN